MDSESAAESFGAAFIQIHLAAILFAAIVLNISSILAGIATYLISIHLLPALVYLLDIRDGRVFKAMFERLKDRTRTFNHLKEFNI